LPLKEALRSRFLQRLRDTPEVLTESAGGCALHENQEWVQTIMAEENRESYI